MIQAQSKPGRTVTIKLFYPGNTPVETIVLPENGNNAIREWRYSLTNSGCIRWGEADKPEDWTTFCGAFKIVVNK